MVDNVRVSGESGQPVLLLPGGAAACDGFFPGIVEGLRADPGARVIEHDRPGTGAAPEDGSLRDAAAHLHALVQDLGLGPVVVVGQSLGGAVAALFARDHPEDVAGVVLLDATPVNDVALSRRVEGSIRIIGATTRIPGARKLLARLSRGAAEKEIRRHQLRPDCAAAFRSIAEIDYAQLAAATRGLAELSADFREADLPSDIPAAVITADRKLDSVVRAAHQRLAAAFGVSPQCWSGATHSVHLDHPDETLAAIREVVRSVAASSSPGAP